MKKILVVAMMVAALALAVPAHAVTSGNQTIDATLASTLAMTTSPSTSVSWALASSGPNTTSGGSVGVNSNQPYSLAVTSDKTRMTEYVTANSAYVSSSPKALTSALTITASRTGGTAPTPGAPTAGAVTGTSSALAAGTGLGTDAYDVTLSQPTLITDPALPSGETYHIVLTYTLSSTL